MKTFKSHTYINPGCYDPHLKVGCVEGDTQNWMTKNLKSKSESGLERECPLNKDWVCWPINLDNKIGKAKNKMRKTVVMTKPEQREKGGIAYLKQTGD